MELKCDILELEKYFSHPKVLETYLNYKKLVSSDSPELNYFGINFDQNGIVSVKFYFAFFKKLEKSDVEKFIPDTHDFYRYYHLWDEVKNRSLEHTGCTFEVKFKGDLNPVLGFHYRLKPCPESYNLIGYPEQVPFDVLNLNTRPGINYEYGEKGILRKKYYYFQQPEHLKFISEKFKKPFAEKIALAEYTEADQFCKVNLWRFDYSKENMNRPSYFSNLGSKIISQLFEKYGLKNVSDGFYEHDKIIATYFFNTDNAFPDSAFERDENTNIDTLKLFIR